MIKNKKTPRLVARENGSQLGLGAPVCRFCDIERPEYDKNGY
jgi:hypothetical protein